MFPSDSYVNWTTKQGNEKEIMNDRRYFRRNGVKENTSKK